MNDLVSFNFKNQVLRTKLTEEGEPLFCLADLCKALDLTSTSVVATTIKEEFEIPKLNLGIIERNTGPTTAYFVTEPQLYYVLLRSRSKKARPFRQWVINEVLPSLRKQGHYTLKSDANTRAVRQLEYLQACWSSNCITREEYISIIKDFCEEYANAD